jgi:hypothetical protein
MGVPAPITSPGLKSPQHNPRSGAQAETRSPTLVVGLELQVLCQDQSTRFKGALATNSASLLLSGLIAWICARLETVHPTTLATTIASLRSA